MKKVKEARWNFTPESVWGRVSTLAKDLLLRMMRKDPEARISYEQLLGHPWFKADDSVSKESIAMTQMVHFNEKRKILATAKVTIAVDLLAETMKVGDDEED